MPITECWGDKLWIDSSRDGELVRLRELLDAEMAKARTSADMAAAILGGPVRLKHTRFNEERGGLVFEWTRDDRGYEPLDIGPSKAP